jgi:tRNA U34 2-thiouridine synthase MnmA/TrmU
MEEYRSRSRVSIPIDRRWIAGRISGCALVWTSRAGRPGRVVVGSREELGQRDLHASGVNWIAGAAPDGPLRVTARIRHRHLDAAAAVTTDGASAAHVRFDEPQLAVTPGQAVVFYDGDEVLGGGWID